MLLLTILIYTVYCIHMYMDKYIHELSDFVYNKNGVNLV